jgi:xanthine dehydrogenase molybdopterin-binding subunit B
MKDQSRPQGGSIEKPHMPKEAMDVYLECVKKARENDAHHSKPVGELTMKLSIDCSDALKGLKAVQSQARKIAQALKDLEHVTVGIDLANGPDYTAGDQS